MERQPDRKQHQSPDTATPSGIHVVNENNSLTIWIRFHIAVRIVIAILMLCSISVSILACFDIDLYTIPTSSFPLLVHIAFNAVMLAFTLYFLLTTTRIDLVKHKLTITRLPWHLPLAISLNTADIADIDMDTDVKSDKYGNKRYRFAVTVSVHSKQPLVLFRTGNKLQADFILRCLRLHLSQLA